MATDISAKKEISTQDKNRLKLAVAITLLVQVATNVSSMKKITNQEKNRF
jgi:hypothetical protein